MVPDFVFNGLTEEFTKEALKYSAENLGKFATAYDAAADYLFEKSRTLFADPFNEAESWCHFFREDESASEFAAKLEKLGFLGEHASQYAHKLYNDNFCHDRQSRSYWVEWFYHRLQPPECSRKRCPVPFH